jgi:hypothetical protein
MIMINSCRNTREGDIDDQWLQEHKKQQRYSSNSCKSTKKATMMISSYMNTRESHDHGEKHKKKMTLIINNNLWEHKKWQWS